MFIQPSCTEMWDVWQGRQHYAGCLALLQGGCEHKSSATLRNLLLWILVGKGAGTLLRLGNHLSPSLGTVFGSPPLLENCLTPRVCVHAAHAEQGGGGKRRPQSDAAVRGEKKSTQQTHNLFDRSCQKNTWWRANFNCYLIPAWYHSAILGGVFVEISFATRTLKL